MIEVLKKIYARHIKKQQGITYDTSSKINIDNGVRLVNSLITLNNSILTIEEGVKIEGYTITLINAQLTIGKNSVLVSNGSFYPPNIFIEGGKLKLENNVSIRCNFNIRFGGELSVGEYSCINENTLIRCDEAISIGKFCMISYECLIFDTNTHNILPPKARRALSIRDFPYVGAEYSRPITKPVIIGNDCWIGQRASILKGVEIGNGAIIGLSAVVTKNVPAGQLAYGNPAQIVNNKIN